MTSTLPFHEWCIIILFCAILLLLSGLVWMNRQSVVEPIMRQHVTAINVTIEGAVAKPGSYDLSPNATMQQLIELAQPLDYADLSNIKERRRLYDGQIIRIPNGILMTIYIEGSVKEIGPMTIRKGTRVSELIEKLDLPPQADVRLLRKRRRFLKEGETLYIPSKKQQTKKKEDTTTQSEVVETSSHILPSDVKKNIKNIKNGRNEFTNHLVLQKIAIFC